MTVKTPVLVRGYMCGTVQCRCYTAGQSDHRRLQVALKRCVAVLVIVLITHSSLAAQAKPLELRWSELSPLILNQSVEVSLAAGATIIGEVAAVRDDSLVLDVKKTSDSKGF